MWFKPRQAKIVTMSYLIKAQQTPQFNWYTCLTSLGANSTPDNLNEEGLKQPDQIKISFKKRAKEIIGHIAPDQAQFWPENFLAFMLPNFKSKFLTPLLNTQMDNGLTLLTLMGQYFQDIGLNEWMSIIAKWCPTKADHVKANFHECMRDYLAAVVRFPNVDNQLIRWLCTTKKPTLMPIHEFMRRQVQLLSYLDGGYIHWTMELPTVQEKNK
jgi:hypothetical protein